MVMNDTSYLVSHFSMDQSINKHIAIFILICKYLIDSKSEVFFIYLLPICISQLLIYLFMPQPIFKILMIYVLNFECTEITTLIDGMAHYHWSLQSLILLRSFAFVLCFFLYIPFPLFYFSAPPTQISIPKYLMYIFLVCMCF